MIFFIYRFLTVNTEQINEDFTLYWTMYWYKNLVRRLSVKIELINNRLVFQLDNPINQLK